MKNRSFWLNLIHTAWQRRSIVWLSGVRRSGKTTLCKSLPESNYYDCDLPSVRRVLGDPESFLSAHRGKTLVFDEIHRLEDPSEILKIAADHFPEIRVLATGSSSLGAAAKFRDTLTGRKTEIWLTPMMSSDLSDIGPVDLDRGLWQGGLPPFFIDLKTGEAEVQEWMDSYWSRDILELFRLERRDSFLKFMELLFVSSGSIFEANTYARPCEVDRKTIQNYLRVLEATHTAHRLKPFHSNRSAEIISAPKVYGFDTGFIASLKGWKDRRPEDRGMLWEHYVLNELHARLQSRRIQYWRDKSGHEIDFVLSRAGHAPIAIECKWSGRDVDLRGVHAFHKIYPKADCFVVGSDIHLPFEQVDGSFRVHFVDLETLIKTLIASS